MKKILAIVLTFVLCFGVLSLAFAAEDEAIAAVPDGYIGIYTAEDLDNIRNNLSGKYILMNDIDLSSYENWNPIGTSDAPFTGELDGNGYTVENMKINVTAADYVFAGLFGAVMNSSINNVEIKNAEINITSDESVYAGILCGDAKESEITDCNASGSLAIETKAYVYAGGISGVLSGNAEGCRNDADIEVTLTGDEEASAYIGGVFGGLEGDTEKSCNNGNIIVSSYLKNKVKRINLGGVAGWSIYGTVNNCYNAENITENTNQTLIIGGVAGFSFTVTNCYNYGALNLTSTEGSFGGITGETQLLSSDFPSMSEPKNKLENCYYLDNISSATTFSYEEQIINVKCLTTEEFKSKDSFVGFDFENVWVMDEKLGRPVFKTEVEPETAVTQTTTEPTTVTTAHPATAETTVTVTETTAETTAPVTTEEVTTKTSTTKVETTLPTTEPTTEESTTELSTKPETDPNNSGEEPCWLIKIINRIIDFFAWIFSVLGC